MTDNQVWDTYNWTEVRRLKEERKRRFFLCEQCGTIVVDELRSLHERVACPNAHYCQECRAEGKHTGHMTYPCPVRRN